MFDKLRRSKRKRDPQTSVTDEALAHRLHDVFERELYLSGVEDVRFAVRDGVVTLSGEARHYLDRRLIAALVERVPGVQGVVNELTVPPFET